MVKQTSRSCFLETARAFRETLSPREEREVSPSLLFKSVLLGRTTLHEMDPEVGSHTSSAVEDSLQSHFSQINLSLRITLGKWRCRSKARRDSVLHHCTGGDRNTFKFLT